MITESEMGILKAVLAMAQKKGAQKAAVTLVKSREDLVATLNGEIDRVTHCEDMAVSITLYVDGRFGAFSTDKLDANSLDTFIGRSVEMVRLLAADSCRDLPDPSRYCTDAVTGTELGLLDNSYYEIGPQMRRDIALAATAFGKVREDGFKLISEEGEYSDSIYDTALMDSSGLVCHHSETSFDYGVEITIEADGDKYSGYWWDSSPLRGRIDAAACGTKALAEAIAQIGSEAVESGKYTLVIDSEMASKVVSPIIRALNGYSIYQGDSFLAGTLGKKVFPQGLTLMDVPRIQGQTGSKYYDSEGVATREAAVILDGEVKQYFVNTYMSHKMRIAPTSEDAMRAKVMPWPKAGLDRTAILRMCRSGILVTDFNGGNCDSATGDFSYGIEGFLFEDGKLVKPVGGMLVTGNIVNLWQGLIAAGDDARPCLSKLIPTLAFANVDFSG